MNLCRSIGLALVAVGVLAHAGEKAVRHSESANLTATVESVDQADRTMVLKGESGAHIVVVAGPDIRNFNQVKVGDRIMLTYMVGVAVQVKPRGTPASAPVEATSENRSAPGQKPAMAQGHSLMTTVKIDSIDTSFNTVTFKRADGITRVVAVEDPDARRFIRSLKPGDSVEISYTEATAVSLEPAGAR